MAKMRWYAGQSRYFFSEMGHHFVRLEDGTTIEVHPTTYNKQFDAYLECIGIEPTSYSEIMDRAQAEWADYCRVMNTFAEDIEQWLDYRGFGVFIEHPTVIEPLSQK